MTEDKIRRKKKNPTDIFPSNRCLGKYEEGDGPTMTELHMATIQAEREVTTVLKCNDSIGRK